MAVITPVNIHVLKRSVDNVPVAGKIERVSFIPKVEVVKGLIRWHEYWHDIHVLELTTQIERVSFIPKVQVVKGLIRWHKYWHDNAL